MRIDAIDGLRALAMTMVVAQHCALLPFGWTGVWLFYAISGYVITRGFLADDESIARGQRWRAFMARRALRIVPAYLAYLAANVIVLAARDDIGPLRELPSLLAFVFNWHMIFAGDAGWAPFGHLWTLSVEQQFYVVFPLLVLCVPRRAQGPLTLALIALGPIVRWGWSLSLADLDAGSRAFAVYAASHAHFDAFLVGSLLARPEVSRRLRRGLGITALGACMLYAVAYAAVNVALGARGIDVLRNLYSGVLAGQGREVFVYVAVDLLAAAVLVHALRGGAFARVLAHPCLAHVGRVSYGAYLWHALVVWGLAHALDVHWKALPIAPRVALFALAWGLTVAIASASMKWLEAPIARWARAPRASARPVEGWR